MKNTLHNYLPWNDFHFSLKFSIHDEDTEFGPHFHKDFYELVMVRAGSARHRLNKEYTHIGAGCFFLIKPGDVHDYLDRRHLEIYNMLFSSDFIRMLSISVRNNSILRFFSCFPPGSFILEDAVFLEVVTLLDDIIAEQKKMLPDSTAVILSDFTRILVYMQRHAVPYNNTDTPPTCAYVISRLITELDHSCEDKWNLSKMAAFCRVSVSTLRQQFKKLTGFTPIDYLLHLRLEKAEMMLKLSNKSISVIALECGFCDSNYFSRQFRKCYGMSPCSCRQPQVSNSSS